MMGSVTDDGPPADDEAVDGDDAWESRFRIASVVCCAVVVLLIVNGIVSGFFLDVGGRQPPSGLLGLPFRHPNSYAFYARASIVLSSFSMFSAILVLLSVLLAVMGRDQDQHDSTPLVVAERVGFAIIAGSLLLWGLSVWWVGANPLEPLSRRIVLANLASPLATAVVAAAATWWARDEQRAA